jgi:hypothetical protein
MNDQLLMSKIRWNSCQCDITEDLVKETGNLLMSYDRCHVVIWLISVLKLVPIISYACPNLGINISGSLPYSPMAYVSVTKLQS